MRPIIVARIPNNFYPTAFSRAKNRQIFLLFFCCTEICIRWGTDWSTNGNGEADILTGFHNGAKDFPIEESPYSIWNLIYFRQNCSVFCIEFTAKKGAKLHIFSGYKNFINVLVFSYFPKISQNLESRNL